jgi:hypothetical protein
MHWLASREFGPLWVHGFNEQIFGANEQVPGPRQRDEGMFGPTRQRRVEGAELSNVPLC